MSHRKPVGRRAQPTSETHYTDAERMPPRRKCRQFISQHPSAKRRCAPSQARVEHQHDMHVGAWLGWRGLTYTVAGSPIPSERSVSARPLQLCTVRLQASSSAADMKDPTTCDRRKRLRSRLGVCTAQAVCAVHTTFAFAVLCHAEALRGPSARVCSFFRKSKRFHMNTLIWHCNASYTQCFCL